MCVLVLALSGCGHAVNPWQTAEEFPIVVMENVDGMSIWSVRFSSDGENTVDYRYAVRNEDGSITQRLTHDLMIGEVAVFEDATAETARIEMQVVDVSEETIVECLKPSRTDYSDYSLGDWWDDSWNYVHHGGDRGECVRLNSRDWEGRYSNTSRGGDAPMPVGRIAVHVPPGTVIEDW
jgi:hypothetical protein